MYYHNVDSNLRRMKIGVPRGSVGSVPIVYWDRYCFCFILMISLELWMKIAILYLLMTLRCYLGPTDMDHCALENKANKYIGYIHSWLYFNFYKLTFNLDKTSYMTFVLYKPHIFNMSLNDLPIKCTNEFKCIGVTIDKRLTWKLLITIVASQLSRILAVIYKPRKKIDKQSLLLLYNSLFHSRLTYCAASWGTNYKHTSNKIIIQQNKLFKCIYKLLLRYDIDFIYKIHNILK